MAGPEIIANEGLAADAAAPLSLSKFSTQTIRSELAAENGLTILNPHFTPNAVIMNKVIAFDFYTNEAGFTASRALQHMGGIDLSQTVNVTTLEMGTALQQYVRPGAVGKYFAPLGTTPLQSGLSITDETLGVFQNTVPVRALRSFAMPEYIYPPGAVVPGSGAGGGLQYFVPNTSAFVPLPH